MAALVASGTVTGDAAGVAQFVRENLDALDTAQLGEYFGFHDDLAVCLYSKVQSCFKQL